MEARQARQTAEAVLTSSSGDLFSLQALTQQQAAEISALRGEATQLKAALDTAQAGAQHAVTEAVTSKEREVREELSAQHAAALEAGHSKIASLEASLATASASASTVDDSQIAALEGQVAQLKAQLAKSEENAVSLSQALDAVAAKATEANDQHAATVASLQAELESAKESASVAAASTAAGGKADAEDVKAIMQEIFAKACEVFDPEAEDAAVAQYSTKDIVKRLKAVLKKVTSERDNA